MAKKLIILKTITRLSVLASLVMGVALLATAPVAAQNYSFSIPKMTVDLVFNSQGIATLDYVYNFTNESGAHPIDYVDIGLPTTDYDMSSITADVNGQAITDITVSSYVSGITLGLGAQTIQPGNSGTVHVSIGVIRGMLYKSTSNGKSYASLNFEPNYFSSQYVVGHTDETISLHLPPGIQQNEPVYYTPKNWPGNGTPQSSYDSQKRVTYTWTATNASSSATYYFGAEFPASYVPASAISAVPAPTSSSSSGGGSGINLGCGNIFVIGFFIFFLISIFGGLGGSRAVSGTRLNYLPPKISLEGHGIKRGLTAVEAGILMQLPLDKVLTMILFGVVKKGAASVATKEPLKLDVTTPAPQGLYPYEVEFLAAFSKANVSDQRLALQNLVVNLVNSVSAKMKGFSQKETVDYYQSIMKQAWSEVETAGTPEVKSQKFDENLEWTMLDRNFDGHTRTVFTPIPVFMPMWWGGFDPAYRGMSTGAAGGVTSVSTQPFGMGGRSSGGLPSLPGADFAASMVNGTSTFAAGAIGNLTSFTGGITNRTNPAPPPTSGGFSGGGGHCACACACAGCACACAGGGR